MAKKNEKETNQAAKTAGSQAEGAVMDESAREKFQQKLKELLALAKKKKNMLENHEISDFFKDMQLSPMVKEPRTFAPALTITLLPSVG